MKVLILLLFQITLPFASGPLTEIDLPSNGYDIKAFRSYCDKKHIPILRDNTIRIFYMVQGRVTGAIEICLETGDL